MADTVLPASFLGLMVSGDINGLTIYTDRYGKKIVYEKAPPDKPPSALQVHQRSRFRDAMTNWRAAGQPVRDAWEAVSLRSHIAMTGLNLWLHFSLKGTAIGLNTFSHQTGITLSFPPAV